MLDILALALSLITLVLYVRQFWFSWRGARLCVGNQTRKIIRSNATTITVDKPFETNSGSDYVIRKG